MLPPVAARLLQTSIRTYGMETIGTTSTSWQNGQATHVMASLNDPIDVMAIRPKILVADDDRDVVDLVRYNLEVAGMDVTVAYDGVQAIQIAEEVSPSLIVLDIMMPKMDGFEVCRYVRKSAALDQTPILVLTARNSEEDEVHALNLGADDFVRKPVSPKRLISRVRALIRRTGHNEPILQIGEYTVDRERFSVFTAKGERIHFPRKEFELLFAMAQKPGRVFTREQLLDMVWGSDSPIGVRTVDVHVRKIRDKIGQDVIETVRGVGYRVME